MSSTPRRSPPDEPAALGFWLYGAHVLTIWGLALSNVFQGLTLLWSGWRWRALRWHWQRSAAILVPAILYLICYVVSTITSIEPRISVWELGEFLALVPLLLGVALVGGERQVRRLVDLLIAMITLLAVLGIAQNYLDGYGTLDRRIHGFFSHYQTFAGVLLIGDLLLVARMAAGNGRRRRWHWAALLAINWTLLLTLTRGAWVAAVVTLTAFALVRTRRYFIAYLAAAAVGALLFVFVAPDGWTARMRSIFDLRDASNYDRLCMVDAGLYMVAERPLFGIGPEVVKSRYPIYRHPTAPRFTVPHLHNTFLEIAAEQGLLSLLAYLWMMGAGVAFALRGYRAQGGARGPRADLYLGVVLVLVGFNLAGLFEDNWRDTEVQRLVLFLLAVPWCLAPEPGTAGEAPAGEPADGGAR